MFCIVTVVAAFLLAIVFEGWPFAAMRNRFIATAGLLISAYVLALVLYYVLFDFSFLPQAAQTPQTPAGAFGAWHSLTFLVTAITGMFLPPAFGFVGFERLQQPVRGLVWSLLCVVWASLLFGLGVGVMGVDPVNFLVWVPVPLLFGGLIVLVVFRDSLSGVTAATAPGRHHHARQRRARPRARVDLSTGGGRRVARSCLGAADRPGPGVDRQRDAGVHVPAAGHAGRPLRPLAAADHRTDGGRHGIRGAARHLTARTPHRRPTRGRRCGSARDEPRGAGHGTAEVTRRSSPLTQLGGCYKVATSQLLR